MPSALLRAVREGGSEVLEALWSPGLQAAHGRRCGSLQRRKDEESGSEDVPWWSGKTLTFSLILEQEMEHFAMPVPFHVLHQAVLESMIIVILDSTPPGYIASHQ